MVNPMLSSLTHNPFIVGGVVFALLYAVISLFSPLIGPYNPLDQQLRLRHQPPLSTGTALDRAQTPPAEEERFYVLGTDHLGRDVLSRLIASFKFNTYTGLLALGLGTGLAWLIFLLRGGPGKAAGSPHRPFPLAVLNSSALVMTGIILGVSYLMLWSYLRVTVYLSRNYEIEPFLFNMVAFAGIMAAFIPASSLYQSLWQAPTASGGNWVWPMVRRTLLLAPVGFSLAALLSLFIEYPWSFLGFGVQPPHSSLSLMMWQGRQYLITAWWVFYIPLTLMVVAIGAFLAIAVPLSRWQNRALHLARPETSQVSAESAPRLERVGAFVVDLLLLWVLKTIVPIILGFLVILLVYFIRHPTLIPWLLNDGVQILAYVLMVLYFPFFWARSGQTPGMRIFGIRVVRTDTTPVSLPRGVLRLVGLAVSSAVLLLGLMWALFDARRQGWHDKIAGTLVIRAEAPDLQHDASVGAPN